MVSIWFLYGLYMVSICLYMVSICLYMVLYIHIYIYMMWLKQFHKPSPSHHHFYRRYAYPSQWVVYGIVLSFNHMIYYIHIWFIYGHWLYVG